MQYIKILNYLLYYYNRDQFIKYEICNFLRINMLQKCTIKILEK